MRITQSLTTRIHILFLLALLVVNQCFGVTASETDSKDRDITDGWSKFTPTTYDTSTYAMNDLKQPGSRIFYISSSSGKDESGEIYFWNGSQIVDTTGSATAASGVAYGSDPMNPSDSIKAFRSWIHVAPRRDGKDIGTPWSGAGDIAPGGYRVRTRYGFPDWWLFKRGDMFDIYKNSLSFAQKTSPGLLDINRGSLAVSGGKSSSKMQIVGAYGGTDQARPRFINPASEFVARWDEPTPKHIAYLSLHFDGHGERNGNGISLMYQKADAVNILFEDCWFDGTRGVVIQKSSAKVTLRRCLITDSWRDDGKRVQGVFFSGNRDSQIRIEESVLMRNGFSHGDPKQTGWPPSGNQIYDVFNRNLYLSGECNNMQSGVFDSISLIGASGDQIRPGMRIERNFFYQGYLTMGAYGGYPDKDGPTGTLIDNVIQRYRGSGTNNNNGQPGWGIGLTSGAHKVEVARNILTNAQSLNADFPALGLSALSWYCYNHEFHQPTRDNYIHHNIFDSGSAGSAIKTVDGITKNCGWNPPGIKENIIENNVIINTNRALSKHATRGEAAGTTDDTIYSGNLLYTDRDDAASKLDWPEPHRTLKSYLESIGYKVSSEDGYIEFFNEAIQQKKGYWREDFESRSIINYFREGFGMESL
ncbi:MAG: hypothetical protein RPU64_05395 [Candidatus Sedimenticola sp. (ex Thyasira tokunagai)]